MLGDSSHHADLNDPGEHDGATAGVARSDHDSVSGVRNVVVVHVVGDDWVATDGDDEWRRVLEDKIRAHSNADEAACDALADADGNEFLRARDFKSRTRQEVVG